MAEIQCGKWVSFQLFQHQIPPQEWEALGLEGLIFKRVDKGTRLVNCQLLSLESINSLIPQRIHFTIGKKWVSQG